MIEFNLKYMCMKRFLIVVALSVILGLLMLAAGCSGGGNKESR